MGCSLPDLLRQVWLWTVLWTLDFLNLSASWHSAILESCGQLIHWMPRPSGPLSPVWAMSDVSGSHPSQGGVSS